MVSDKTKTDVKLETLSKWQ